MNTELSPSMCTIAPGSLGATNWGRNAKKNSVSFGFRMFTRIPETITASADRGAASPVTASAPFGLTIAHAM